MTAASFEQVNSKPIKKESNKYKFYCCNPKQLLHPDTSGSILEECIKSY